MKAGGGDGVDVKTEDWRDTLGLVTWALLAMGRYWPVLVGQWERWAAWTQGVAYSDFFPKEAKQESPPPPREEENW